MHYQTQTRAKARAMVGATALGSVMGLTFSGAYLAGGMANAAVLDTSSAEVEAASPTSSNAYSTPRVEIGSATLTSRDIRSAFDPVQRAYAASADQAQPVDEDAASKLGAFQQRYNIAGEKSFPAVEQSSEYTMRKSGRELDCLTAALYYEARGEGQSGMEAVAQVIVNRARHPDFPKSLCGVIYQGAGRGRGCQFSFACDGSMRRRSETALWDRARAVAERAMDGRVSDEVGNSTFFHATRISPNWRGLTRVATVGRHVFYRHAGARGSGANFLRGTVGDMGGVELASVVEKKARVYKVAGTSSRPSRAERSIRASLKAEAQDAPAYRIARMDEDAVTVDASTTVETVTLDTLVDSTPASGS